MVEEDVCEGSTAPASSTGSGAVEMRELFRLAAESSRDLIIIGRPGAPEWISPSVVDLLGYTREQYVEMATDELVHPDDLPGVMAARPAIARGERAGGRCRLLHRDGTYRWLEARVSPLADDDGSFSGRSVSTWRPVDREVEAMARLRESEQRFRLLVEHVADGVILERDGCVTWASPNLERMLGWSVDSWAGRPILEMVGPHLRAEVAQALEASARDEAFTLRLEVRGARGAPHWVELQCRPFRSADGTRDGTACAVRVIDGAVAAERELERRARYDQLTGLLNRNEIIDRLEAVGGDLRQAGRSSAVLFCDLDGFKDVNDTRGHATGDQVLATVAARVAEAVRDSDLVARFGGDELLVVLQHLHGVDDALAIAEQVRHSVGHPIVTPFGTVTLSVSIGVTMVGPGDTADAVIARADQAMYGAKEAGRDRVVCLDPQG